MLFPYDPRPRYRIFCPSMVILIIPKRHTNDLCPTPGRRSPSVHSPFEMLFFFLKILKTILPLPLHLVRIRFPPLLLIRINIKALRVALVPHRRYNRAPIFPIINIVPSHPAEEWMVFHSRCATGYIAESVGTVNCAELPDYVFGFCADGGFVRKGDGFGYDSKPRF
jgi:hypothetical protein